MLNRWENNMIFTSVTRPSLARRRIRNRRHKQSRILKDFRIVAMLSASLMEASLRRRVQVKLARRIGTALQNLYEDAVQSQIAVQWIA